MSGFVRLDEELRNFDYARRPIKSSERVRGPIPYLGASGVVDHVEGFTHDGEFICVSEDGENLRSRNTPIAWVQRGQFWANNHLHVLGGVPLPRLRFYAAAIEASNISGYLTGSAQPKLSQDSLNAITIPRLTPYQQMKIGEVLGALDDKIAANSRVIETSMQLGETLARRYATAPKPLEDIATITMGTSPKGEFLNEQGEGLPFYQGVRDFGVISPTERVFTESPVRTTPAGSILFAVRAPVGEVNLAPSETAIGRGVAGFHSEAQTATMFFGLRVFASIWDQFDGGGTVFSSVTAAEVRTAMLPMPSDEEASRVEQTLSALLTRATAANQENIALARTRDELLPLLMSGRMKVGDVQARVEEVM